MEMKPLASSRAAGEAGASALPTRFDLSNHFQQLRNDRSISGSCSDMLEPHDAVRID